MVNTMTRDWKKLENDEIVSIWKGYLQTEFQNYDPLRMKLIPGISNMRLTPLEIIRLVDELMERLDIKFKEETPFNKDKNET